MNSFCTIISPDYLPFACSLFQSLQLQAPGVSLHVLVTGDDALPAEPSLSGIKIDRMADLAQNSLAHVIESKYGNSGDSLRWAIKPVYLLYLLRQYEKVIYTDADIFFAADPRFLLDELNGHTLLLCPHWGNPDPAGNTENFLLNFRMGLFNAGFIGAAAGAEKALEWWAAACIFNIRQLPEKGLFDDQRYLDLLPVTETGTRILRHRGCNLGSWNMDTNIRGLSGGKLVINNEYPVIFIHFNKETIRQVLNRNDALLHPYLEQYNSLLNSNGFDLFSHYQDLPERKYDTAAYKVKHKLRLRTRLKRFFYRLAEKL